MQRVTFKITEVKVYEHSVLMPRGFSERAARKKARETWDSINKLCNIFTIITDNKNGCSYMICITAYRQVIRDIGYNVSHPKFIGRDQICPT